MALKLKAKVTNGRICVDEPTDLPEGTVVELVEDDPYAYLDHEEHEIDPELEASLERGMQQIEAGLGIPAEQVLQELKG